jgi:hypothetical protein
MVVIAIYVLLVAVGQVVAVTLGIYLDKTVPAGWSIILAMGLFFGVFAVMWPVAVFVTERWVSGTAKQS